MTNTPDTTEAVAKALEALCDSKGFDYFYDSEGYSDVNFEGIAKAAIEAHNKAMREAPDVIDRVAIILRRIDGNDEIETTQDHEGDQAYGYRADAIEIVNAILGEGS